MNFNIMVLDGAFASGVAVTLDALLTAKAMAKHVGSAAPTWRVCSASGGSVRLSSGLTLDSDPLDCLQRDDASVWVIAGLAVSSAAALRQRLDGNDAVKLARAIAAHVARGGRVAASCSAVFLLERAGVIAGKTVTATWWLASALRKLQPTCLVDTHRMVIQDGCVTTAGAALGHTDLVLHLLQVHAGAALSHTVAQVLLIDKRSSQASYVIPAMLATGDALISCVTAHIEAMLPSVPSVGELAASVRMSERTFARHVAASTGLPPTALIQQVRLARAKVLLEDSRMSVEQVAAAVGYIDATSLRRLLKKAMNLTPMQMRRRQI